MAKRSRLIKLETYQHRQSGIQARSLNQRVLDKWLHDPQKDIVITVGPAGTGKTLLACDRGMMAFRKGLYEKILQSFNWHFTLLFCLGVFHFNNVN